VYSSGNYQNDWKGTNQSGDNLPDGTYYYVIYFDDSDTVLKGAITLLRNP
jgi:flagellar hook assembly protein FlgD